MLALITGASSGIGREIAKVMSEKGYDLILVARRVERLEELAKSLKCACEVVCCDLSEQENCYKLYKQFKDRDIDVLVNSAGFGVYGEFAETDLETELNMIKTNIFALHILTKLYAVTFVKKGRGHILNVASSAGFMAGPMLSSYYASKAYVLRLSEAINEELRRKSGNVNVSVLCPGPVETEFDSVAGVGKSMGGLSAEYVAKYAVEKMFKGKMVIIPGKIMKLSCFAARFLPEKLMVKITYKIQAKKRN